MPKLINNAELSGMLDTLPVDANSKVSVELLSVWFEKTADKTVWTDGLLTYVITIKNTGDAEHAPAGTPMTDVSFADVIEPTIAKVIESSIAFTPPGAEKTKTYDPVSGTLEVELNDIPEGNTVTITFQVSRVV